MKCSEYVSRLKRERTELEFLEEPKYVKESFKVRCKISGEIFYPTIYNLNKGTCCKSCGINKSTSNKRERMKSEFLDLMKNKLPHIQVIGEYELKKKPIEFYCKTHDGYFFTTPETMLQRLGCEISRKEYISKAIAYSNEEYVNMFNDKVVDISLMSKYSGMRSKVKLKCHICDYEWDANAYYVLKGVGCPQCNESKGEKKIRTILKENGIKYEREVNPTWCNGARYRYDFYLPKYNIMLEFDGKQHFMEFTGNVFKETTTLEERIESDRVKDTLCVANNVKLLRISFSEIDNLHTILVPSIYSLSNSSENIIRIGKEYN